MNIVQLLYQMVNRFCEYQEARAAKDYDVARQALLVSERAILDYVAGRMLLGEPGVDERGVIISAAHRYRGAIDRFMPRHAPASAKSVYMRQYRNRKERKSCHKPQRKPKSGPKPALRSRRVQVDSDTYLEG